MASQIFVILTSALSYFAFRLLSLSPLFLNSPKNPLSSSVSKSFSCATTSVNRVPTSPISLVRTLLSAVSEKSAIFFWLPAPYCNTAWVLVRSICAAKSSTCFCSSGVSSISGTACSSTNSSGFFSTISAFASAKGSSVRVGDSFVAASKSMFILISLPQTIPFVGGIANQISIYCFSITKSDSVRPSFASMVCNTCASADASKAAS